MGLGGAIPLLLAEKGASEVAQAAFSVVSYPFSFKLLWAPLVDSVYSSVFGRRKTWIVPAQAAIGALLLWASPRIGSWLEPQQADPASKGGPDVSTLTYLFFSFYFLAATQDIAVDGLALTILSPRNKELGATCNAIGQTLGTFLACELRC
jgi:PAT family acetyl-CoA transporter-like MFS transporter 1